MLALTVVGCAEDTIEPADRVISVGTYAYEGRYLHPTSGEWGTFQGGLVLESADPDSIHGRWTMQGFRPDSTGGYWNENAYVFRANSADGVIELTHRIWRFGSPSVLRCSLNYREDNDDAEPISTGGTCTLSYQN